MPIKVITFDLDDTLWHLPPVIRAAEQKLHDWLGDNMPKVVEQFSVEDLRQMRVELLEANPEFVHQLTQLRIVGLEKAMAAAGYDQGTARRQARLGFEVFLHARHEVEFFEDALEVLEQLNEHYTLGVLTNGNASVERLGIDRYFDFAFTAEQLKASKPAPEVFLAAADISGAQPEQIVHVGDHVDYDIRAAQAVGFHTVWVNMTGAEWPGGEAPDATITRLKELPAAIAAL